MFSGALGAAGLQRWEARIYGLQGLPKVGVYGSCNAGLMLGNRQEHVSHVVCILELLVDVIWSYVCFAGGQSRLWSFAMRLSGV